MLTSIFNFFKAQIVTLAGQAVSHVYATRYIMYGLPIHEPKRGIKLGDSFG